jgi:hypothetical protein
LGEEKKISHITRNLFVTMSANGRIGDAAKVRKSQGIRMLCYSMHLITSIIFLLFMRIL